MALTNRLSQLEDQLGRANRLRVVSYLLAFGEGSPSEVAAALGISLATSNRVLRELADAQLAERAARIPTQSSVLNIYRLHPLVQGAFAVVEAHLTERHRREVVAEV